MKKKYFILMMMISFCAAKLMAQKENVSIKKGNRLYKEQKFDDSKKQYQKALEQSPDNASANYNMGNADFRKNSFDDAVKSYDAAAKNATDNATKEKSLYNKGVASIKQQKLEESIAAWKDALKIDPADEEARDNLIKAIRELKNKQQQQQQQNKDDKKKQDKKEDNKDQQKQDQDKQQQQQPPQPQKSRLTKQQVEQLLKALQQKEKDVQDKMNQNKVRSLSQPDKDW